MVTKREAVQALIRGAMRAVREGDDVCGLTLAGAAEEAMPRADGPTGYDVMKVVRVCMRCETDTRSARSERGLIFGPPGEVGAGADLGLSGGKVGAPLGECG